MIRVKLLSEREYSQMLQERTCREYQTDSFYDLLRQKETFDDEDSCRLIRTLHGDNAVEGKWYRRTTPEGKPCLPAISAEVKYGLTVIENSRQGVYTNFVEDFSAFEVQERMDGIAGGRCDIPLVWDAFSALDMDVLLVYRRKDFSFGWDIPIDNAFILENYPWHGTTVEAYVLAHSFGDDPVERDDGIYIGNFFFDQKYDWVKASDELLDVLHDLNCQREPLAMGTFPFSEFQKMLGWKDWLDDREEWEDDDQGDPREELQVINHMAFLPEPAASRRVQYIIIEKCGGTYCLRSGISVKYPSYVEMLDEVMRKAVPAGEVFVLPVDVNESMMCTADIKKAVCAFRVADVVIETFGREEGLVEFEKLLWEAKNSGKYSIRKDV